MSGLMAKTTHLDHLASVPLFSACSRKELGLIARAATETSLAAGSTLMQQDTAAREAFVIVEGNATVTRNGRKIATIGPGAIVGELGLLDRGPRTASVKADTPLTVLVLGPREFAGLLDEVPSITHKLLKALASQVRELDSKTFG